MIPVWMVELTAMVFAVLGAVLVGVPIWCLIEDRAKPRWYDVLVMSFGTAMVYAAFWFVVKYA